MGTLYVVATPIGNLEEMSPRAIATLKSVNLIACEDTRRSATLLRAFNIETPMISYHKHNLRSREDRLLRALTEGDVALISDAGTPGIADPGLELVEAAHREGIRVVPISGPSAVASAVSVAGFVKGPFLFLGFLTRTGDERRAELARAAAVGYPVVIYESPVRLGETIADLAAVFGGRRAMVARELSKLHEELAHGTLVDLRDRYADAEVKGEIVIVIDGATESVSVEIDVRAVIRGMLEQGMKPSRIAREAASLTDMPGSDVYELVRELQRETPS
ncbi:MAG TPA: 16S rRNA (cytidine(1402)-2'-O)-methyltransferase [Thermomicrobiales bacterium]|nr:16S rRNA (cytidine(1402)-2'-O)-methyltransferase [Thermomicrobiales bacterium]